MKKALLIIDNVDALTITKEDKDLIVAVIGKIVNVLEECKQLTPEMDFQYAVLKCSVWDDGYFCIVARKTCAMLYPIVKQNAYIEEMMEASK